MSEKRQCPSCGTNMRDDLPAGLCAACLLAQALPPEPAAPAPAQASLPATVRLDSAQLTEQPGDRIGRYKLLQQIGEGGCGVVYMAAQEEPIKRRVALKVIKPGMDSKQVLGRFEAERQVLALMDHPNIAKVLDAGATASGRPYFVMELVHGIPATRYCDENKLNTRQRLGLFIKICQAVQHAHQKGIIHRDIKPSNILVADHDGVAVPKVIDFGIAKATSGQELTTKTVFTAFEQFMGTPAYMSPEQAKLSGLDIDTRSDIYSLGVLLYELLTGKTPFDANELYASGLDEIRRIIREVEPPRPSTRLSTLEVAEQTRLAGQRQSDPPKLQGLIRGDLDWIVMKCLEKDRTRRYETANGLAADLQRHLENEPVSARPPSQMYRLQKMMRRNKLIFSSISAIFIALWAGLGTSMYFYAKASRALQLSVPANLAEGYLREKLIATHRAVVLGQEFPRVSPSELRQERHHHVDYVNALNELAFFLWQQKRLPEAETLFNDSLVVRRANPLSQPLNIADAVLTLSEVLLEEKKYPEVESLLRQNITLFQRDPNRLPEETAELCRELQILYATQALPGDEKERIRQLVEEKQPATAPVWKLGESTNHFGVLICEDDKIDRSKTDNGLRWGCLTTNVIAPKRLDFDGTNDAIEIDNPPNPRVFTVSVWVSFGNLDSPASWPGLQYLVFRKNSRINNFEGVSLAKNREDLDSADRFVFEATSADGDNTKIQSTTEIQTGVRYNVVATFNGSFLRLYVDGIEEAASYHPYPIDYGGRPLFVGTSGEIWDGRFLGTLQKVSLADTVLSPEQVYAQFQLGK